MDWGQLATATHFTIEQARTIQQIPAPTFHELERAQYMESQFHRFGLADVHTDALYNAYGRLPGSSPSEKAVIVMAHTDTVFPAGTDLTLRQEGDLIYGPGLGDNSIGTGALLGLLQMLTASGLTPRRDIWFVATSREEGLGDLGGVKAAFTYLKDRAACVINLEGLAFGHIYNAGIAVRRLKISATTPGGHSWLHFGRPSATHAIVELGSRILTIRPPENPRTTYNIGLLEGGQGINVIATQAALWLDMRSEAQGALLQLEKMVRQQVDLLTTEETRFTVEIVGDRPSGAVSPEHELVQGALAALAQVGIQGTLESGSTDANVPLAEGCPAVTIGIARGGNAHRLDEYVDTEPVESGLRQLILLTWAMAIKE